jgi:lysophospholipase L1-like esterase
VKSLLATWPGKSYLRNELYYADRELLKTLASSSGAATVYTKKPTSNAALTTQYDLNLQSVSIQEYGNPRAIDDYNGSTGTNCWSALQLVMTDFPNGCKIRFPKTVGGTGRYYMSGSGSSSDMSKYIIELDQGVDVTHLGAATPLMGPGLVVNRELKINLLTYGYTFHLSPTAYGGVCGKPYFLSSGDGEAPVLERVITNLDLSFNTVNPSTGAQSGYSSASSDGNISSFGSIPSGQFIVGSAPVRPGWEVHAQVTMPGSTASVAAYIQTENGWVIYSQPIGGGNITRYVFLEGYSVQTTTITPPLADNPAYNMDVAEIGIKVHSPVSFSVLCNHVEIHRMDGLTSNIIAAGWGAGLANNTNTAYISYPVRAKRNKGYGMRPLRIVAVGDSTADKNNPFSWVNHMVRVMSGVGGVQFKTILNQAVAGQTSVQQAAIFNATDFQALGGFDYALIDIGINDIGGSVATSDFITAIVSMITTCTTYNITPIIGLPALFYNQSAATPYGQTGQPSANADRGAPYRLQLLRKLAELNVQVALLPIQDMGAIVPSLLSTSLDPVVQDNVHQSGFGAELKGRGWAKAFTGYLFARTRKEIASRTVKAAWIPSAISATYGVSVKPSFSINANEFAMSGLMDTPASVPNGTALLQLPPAYAPVAQIYVPVICLDVSSVPLSSTATIRVDTSGLVVALTVPSTSRYICFGNVHYSLPD